MSLNITLSSSFFHVLFNKILIGRAQWICRAPGQDMRLAILDKGISYCLPVSASRFYQGTDKNCSNNYITGNAVNFTQSILAWILSTAGFGPQEPNITSYSRAETTARWLIVVRLSQWFLPLVFLNIHPTTGNQNLNAPQRQRAQTNSWWTHPEVEVLQAYRYLFENRYAKWGWKRRVSRDIKQNILHPNTQGRSQGRWTRVASIVAFETTKKHKHEDSLGEGWQKVNIQGAQTPLQRRLWGYVF